MKDYAEWSFEDITTEISDSIIEGTQENIDFYDGDHWQGGAGWVGPLTESSHPLHQTTHQAVENTFVSSNKIAEVCDRERNAAVGRDPAWAFHFPEVDEPNEAQIAVIDEATALFRWWWDERKGLEMVQKAVVNAMLSERGLLRLYVPSGLLDDEGTISPTDFANALSFIYLEAPSPLVSTVYLDDTRKTSAGLYSYVIEDDEGEELQRGEMTYLDDDGNTVIRIIDDQGIDVIDPVSFAMGGQLSIKMVERKLMITTQVKQLQKAINMVLTMMSRSMVQAGFLERYFMNAQLPVVAKKDESTGEIIGYEPAPLVTGPGASQFLAGIVTTDEEGNQTVASPSVAFHEPTSPASFIMANNEDYQRLLEEVDQIHVLIMGEATPSGKSREEARDEFRGAVLESARLVEELTRWLLRASMTFAADLLNQSGSFVELRPTVTANIRLGTVSGAEQDNIIAGRDAGIISTETARSRMGVDDLDAEQQKVDIDKADSLDLLLKQAEVVQTLTASGADLETAAIIAGMTPEQAKMLYGDAIEDDEEPDDEDEDADIIEDDEDDEEE